MVIGIIAIFAGVIGVALRNAGSETVGLKTAQTTLIGLLNLARSHAATTGSSTALWVHNDPSNPERYQRFLVVAELDGTPVNDGTTLPAGCFVLPYGGPGSAIETGADWTGLSSTALSDQAAAAILSSTSESWRRISYTKFGTTGSSGRIALCNGWPQPGGSPTPAVFKNPDNVLGVSISGYGQITVLNARQDFQ